MIITKKRMILKFILKVNLIGEEECWSTSDTLQSTILVLKGLKISWEDDLIILF